MLEKNCNLLSNHNNSKMNKLLQSSTLAVLLFLLLFSVSSCIQDPKQEQEQTQAEQTGPKIDFKHKDNTVHVRLPAEPDRLNPLLSVSGYSRFVHGNIFLPLLQLDSKSLEEVPYLVKARPSVSPINDGEYAGGTAYTYELREDAKWSDGKDITAADVIFSFKVLFNLNINEASPYRQSFFFLTDIQEDPNSSKKFTVYTNQAFFLAESSINGMTVLPAHAFDPDGLMAKFELADMIKDGSKVAQDAGMKAFAETFVSAPYSRDGDKLIGSGPYRLEKWEEGQMITMSKVDNWWVNDNHPHLVARPDSLVYRVITDQDLAVNALKDELVDISTQVDANSFISLKEDEFMSEHYQFHTPDAFVYYFIALNNGDPKLADKRVRRALAHLVDVDYLVDEHFHGMATRMTSCVVPAKSYYDKSLKAIELDINKAKELLSEAGWTDSDADGVLDKKIDGKQETLELEYLVSPGSKLGNLMAEFLKDNAAQVGIQINIVPREFRTMMSQDVASRKYQMYGGAASGYPQDDDFSQLWHTSSNNPQGGNRTQFGNAQTDAIIDKIRVTLDDAERDALYKEFQQIVYEEQPMIFLFSPKERILISKRFDAEASVIRPGFDVTTFKHKQ